MSKIIDYYFAPISPWTYLGNQRLVAMAQENDAVISYKPVKILELFERTGGVPVGQRPPARQKYRMAELIRWRDFLGVELTLTPKFFPVPDELAARLTIACEDNELQGKLAFALMRATWAQERDISDEETLVVICNEVGADAVKLLEVARSDEVSERLSQNTDDAVNADVFGAPSYVLNGEVFWGQDRLDFLERALKS